MLPNFIEFPGKDPIRSIDFLRHALMIGCRCPPEYDNSCSLLLTVLPLSFAIGTLKYFRLYDCSHKSIKYSGPQICIRVENQNMKQGGYMSHDNQHLWDDDYLTWKMENVELVLSLQLYCAYSRQEIYPKCKTFPCGFRTRFLVPKRTSLDPTL